MHAVPEARNSLSSCTRSCLLRPRTVADKKSRYLPGWLKRPRRFFDTFPIIRRLVAQSMTQVPSKLRSLRRRAEAFYMDQLETSATHYRRLQSAQAVDSYHAIEKLQTEMSDLKKQVSQTRSEVSQISNKMSHCIVGFPFLTRYAPK